MPQPRANPQIGHPRLQVAGGTHERVVRDCWRAAYVIGPGAAKLIALGAAKLTGVGAAKLIASGRPN